MNTISDPAEQMIFEGMEPNGASSRVAAAKRVSIPWSYSRRNLLQQCPLSYYFEYYGSKKRTAEAEPRKESLRFLKGLSNRHLRTGEITHLVIRTYLNRLREGEEWSLERLVSWARDMLHTDVEFSRAYRPNNPLPRSAAAIRCGIVGLVCRVLASRPGPRPWSRWSNAYLRSLLDRPGALSGARVGSGLAGYPNIA